MTKLASRKRRTVKKPFSGKEKEVEEGICYTFFQPALSSVKQKKFDLEKYTANLSCLSLD